MSDQKKIVCYGEVLWDVFPDKKRLGGAPFNVAHRLHSIGANVAMLSALGKDALGKTALEEIKKHGISTDYIQINKRLTGQVNVTLDASGNASYEIGDNAAWDCIEITKKDIELTDSADALIFGSLAFRGSANQEHFEKLISGSKYNVFDLNLRDPHYDLDIVMALMDIAHLIKLNDEELELIVTIMDLSKDSLEDELKAISEITNTPSICVTMGAEGAMLLHEGKIYTQTGYPTKVVDTVGAGDSFLAGLVFGLLTEEGPLEALQWGSALGSLVAGKAGATPEISVEEVEDVIFG